MTPTAPGQDAALFAECCDLAERSARRIARRRPWLADDAAALAVLVLVRVWHKRHNGPPPFMRYLRMAVKTAVRRLVASEERHRGPAVTPDAVARPVPTGLGFEEMLRGLSRRHAEVLRLYYQHGLTQREVGLLLGVSECRVYQLHTEAVERIRERADAACT